MQRLEKEYSPTYIYIESQDPERLNARIHSCKKFVKTEIDSIVCVSSSERKEHDYDLVVFGGGEVVSDARPRPYNGRNYLL